MAITNVFSSLLRPRNALALMALGAVTLTGAGYTFEALGENPCDLCIQQQDWHHIAAATTLVFSTLAAKVSDLKLSYRLSQLGIVAGILTLGRGAYIAASQWLEAQGSTIAGFKTCDMDRAVSTTSCSDIDWEFLGRSMAEYNMGISGALMLVGLISLMGAKPPKLKVKATKNVLA